MSVRAVLALSIACLAASSAWAAGTSSVTVSAVLVSKNVCKFSSTSKNLAIVVKNDATGIDPTLATAATGTATASFSCNGNSSAATFVIAGTDGAHSVSPGVRRMQHATVPTSFLPYALSFSPASATVAKGSTVNVVITATVVQSDFAVARVGSYSDTVAVTVSP